LKGELIILKLGGSVITFKNSFEKANLKVLRRIAGEVKEAIGDKRLIIVHGGGSFGHPHAYKYKLHLGFRASSQLPGVLETHMAMEKLNKIVVEEFSSQGLPTFPFQVSSSTLTSNGEIDLFPLNPLRRMIELGIIPILYGDVVFDRQLGFCILSGDKICSFLAVFLKASKLIFICDVDGVYDSNPKLKSPSKFYEKLSLDELKLLLRKFKSFSSSLDVTGGFYSKLVEASKAVEKGVNVLIVNGLFPGRVSAAIRGVDFIGTRISVK